MIQPYSLCLRVVFAAFAVLIFAAPSWLYAAPVPLHGQVPVTETSLSDESLAGEVVESREMRFWLSDPRFAYDYDLHLLNYVVRSAATGTLDFYYRLTNASDKALRVVDLDTGEFTRSNSIDPVDVGYLEESESDLAPLQADRETSRFNGVVLEFPFFDELAPGESTPLFYIRTRAMDHTLGGVTAFRSTPGLSSSGNGFVATFSPVLEGEIIPLPPQAVAIPLPTPVWIGIVGLAMVGVVRGTFLP